MIKPFDCHWYLQFKCRAVEIIIKNFDKKILGIEKINIARCHHDTMWKQNNANKHQHGEILIFVNYTFVITNNKCLEAVEADNGTRTTVL